MDTYPLFHANVRLMRTDELADAILELHWILAAPSVYVEPRVSGEIAARADLCLAELLERLGPEVTAESAGSPTRGSRPCQRRSEPEAHHQG